MYVIRLIGSRAYLTFSFFLLLCAISACSRGISLRSPKTPAAPQTPAIIGAVRDPAMPYG